MPVLTTTRLNLRPLQMDDFAAVHAYASVLDNVLFMPWGPNTEGQTIAFLEKAIATTRSNPDSADNLAVVLRESDQVIGGCGLSLTADLTGSLGWILHRDYWGQGYGTELAAELIRFGFEDLQLHRIWASCHRDNVGSYRVMEHNEMRREAHFVQKRRHRGTWSDELIYALLASEWRARQAKRKE